MYTRFIRRTENVALLRPQKRFLKQVSLAFSVIIFKICPCFLWKSKSGVESFLWNTIVTGGNAFSRTKQENRFALRLSLVLNTMQWHYILAECMFGSLTPTFPTLANSMASPAPTQSQQQAKDKTSQKFTTTDKTTSVHSWQFPTDTALHNARAHRLSSSVKTTTRR